MHGYIFKIETLGVDIAAGEKWKEVRRKKLKRRRGEKEKKNEQKEKECVLFGKIT